MKRTLRAAAVNMDLAFAPPVERLTRAGRLVEQAAGSGAQLVLLPELFNVGYRYCDENYGLAEPPRGPTSVWMKETAARLNIHLAGTLMLLEDGEIYNALLLFAPDGRVWRYDKNYPWGWERAYFRPAQPRCTVVAETDLGNIGMLICWDVGHAHLWKQYAGKVDLMIASSCPPDMTRATYAFPNGDKVEFKSLSPLIAALENAGNDVFVRMVEEQTAWLGVPLVQTSACGQLVTPVPAARWSVLSMALLAPRLLRYVSQAPHMQACATPISGCRVLDAAGRELGRAETESAVVASVALPEARPTPSGPQPRARANWFSYLNSDVTLPAFTTGLYQRGVARLKKR